MHRALAVVAVLALPFGQPFILLPSSLLPPTASSALRSSPRPPPLGPPLEPPLPKPSLPTPTPPPPTKLPPPPHFATPVNKVAVAFFKSAIFDRLFAGADEGEQRQAQQRQAAVKSSDWAPPPSASIPPARPASIPAVNFRRFFALETIARMPYFAYTSMLHLYETLGWWRRHDYIKLHFAEAWNELHHLLIMEDLGGNTRWGDRVVAAHLAFGYYWFVVVLYAVDPKWAYNFNEHVERHAYETYDAFLNEYEQELKKLPAPKIAVDYYVDAESDLLDFNSFQTCSETIGVRVPKARNLFDVFVNIRDDELDHVNTMTTLQRDEPVRVRSEDGCEL
ncbi:hypothetical protein TeGR_g12121 [Tetraparma gracilis]|uniref:Ubiquinol oxidase n=1 Tax=Tetraparma gracilis TaxID=2962635 RepID=A0ABQ6M874_9STRA|nr:hypothetical protein TeGR_g12121 [Tetraparma gracilis]